MKTIIKGIVTVLAMIATSAHAVPTLEFYGGDAISGGVTYTATERDEGILEVDAYLIGSTDISPLPILTDSSLTFSGSFDGPAVQNGDFTVGSFTSTNLVVTGGGVAMTELLTGSFTQLAVAGQNGTGFGFIVGTFEATGGSLISEFGLGTLFALELNLSTFFSEDIFKSNFTAEIDGEITGEPVVNVPEPSIIALLGAGILLFGFSYRARTASKFNA